MRQGTYYLNNSDSRWVHLPKEKVLLFHGAKKYCKERTVEFYESFGNYAVACLRYEGRLIKGFIEDCNGRKVLFVDYKENY